MIENEKKPPRKGSTPTHVETYKSKTIPTPLFFSNNLRFFYIKLEQSEKEHLTILLSLQKHTKKHTPLPSSYILCTLDETQVLALHLKGEKRDEEAVDVMKRIRAMEEELAGVPEDQQGAEEEEQDGAQGTEGSV